MIDTHTHLSDKSFDKDRNFVIEKAKGAGVKKFIEVFTSPNDWQLYNLFEKDDDFYFVFGIHPHYSNTTTSNDMDNLKYYLAKEKVVGIGEAGIDLWYNPQTLNKQLELFEKTIELSKRLNKPLILHLRSSRDGHSAYKVAIDFISQRKNQLSKIGIVHSFSGKFDEAKKFVELGFLIGINATITYPKNQNLREVVNKLDIEHILTETDSPYLPPQRIRGKRNDPTSIIDIIEAISEIKNLPLYDVDKTIELNFLKFLNQSL